jgi:hypothetical protein
MSPVEPFLVLLLAHLIGDFVFQTEQMAMKKAHVSGWLLLHASELGILSWVLCWNLECWPVIVAVFATHMIFDWGKPRLPGDQLYWYLLDQAGHILVIWIGAVWMAQTLPFNSMPISAVISIPMQAIFCAYILIARPITIGLGLFLKPWRDEILKGSNQGAESSMTGLTKSGEWVGILERFVTLTAVLVGQYILVAAVLVAKGIMRFGEISQPGQRKRSDYILIGTFGSVGLAIVVGLLARLFFAHQPDFMTW